MEGVKPMLESAQQNGIKVIAFDTDYEGSTADSFVGASLDAQYHSGEQAADILVKQTGKTEGKVAMLTGSMQKTTSYSRWFFVTVSSLNIPDLRL